MSARIPLRRRDGSVAYALVDPEDFAEFGEHRWCRNARGYVIRFKGPRGAQRAIWLHREVMRLEPGDPWEVDHINGDPLDNRRANLRLVTHAENCQNIVRRTGRSGVRGVSWKPSHGKWRGRVMVDGREHLAGYFDTIEEAAEAVRALRARLMPYSEESRS